MALNGGKHYLARWIVSLFPRHTHYVEPFAGGLSVLLARDPEGVSEVVCDLNLDLTNFWKVLQGGGSFGEFRRLCEATPFSEVEWKDADLEFAEWPVPCEAASAPSVRAWRFFVWCRQSLAGRMKGFSGVTKTRTRRGMNNEVSAWLTCVEGLPAVHARLKRVLVLEPQPALRVVRKHDGPDTLHYIDPPYLHETRATTGEYAHEMTEDDHRELLDALAGLRGRFLLSGYPSALYDGFAAARGWRRFDRQTPNHAAGGGSKRTMTECVWANFDPGA